MTTTLLGMWSDNWANMVNFEKLGVINKKRIYRMFCKNLFLDFMALHVAWRLMLVGLASMMNWIQIASCPTYTNLTSITTNMIHNSTYSAVACLGTNVDVAMWAEYRGILCSLQF
jgi:hypothetical protein